MGSREADATAPAMRERNIYPTSTTMVEAPLADLDGPMLGKERDPPATREIQRFGQRAIFVRPAGTSVVGDGDAGEGQYEKQATSRGRRQ
jgi:hypothetical protein